MVDPTKRHDGRMGNELRPFACDQGALFRADGSARMSHGSSTVLVAVYGPGQAKSRRNEQIDRVTLDVCFKLDKGVTSSKEKEYEQLIRRTFEPLVIAEDYPRAVISIVVQVIEDNGSLLSVAINATMLALMNAGVPMLSVVTSSTCAMLPDGSIFLDPSLTEEEQSTSLITTASSYTNNNGILTSVTSGLLSEEEYFAASEACQRASESVAAFIRLVLQKKYPLTAANTDASN